MKTFELMKIDVVFKFDGEEDALVSDVKDLLKDFIVELNKADMLEKVIRKMVKARGVDPNYIKAKAMLRESTLQQHGATMVIELRDLEEKPLFDEMSQESITRLQDSIADTMEETEKISAESSTLAKQAIVHCLATNTDEVSDREAVKSEKPEAINVFKTLLPLSKKNVNQITFKLSDNREFNIDLSSGKYCALSNPDSEVSVIGTVRYVDDEKGVAVIIADGLDNGKYPKFHFDDDFLREFFLDAQKHYKELRLVGERIGSVNQVTYENYFKLLGEPEVLETLV